MFDKCIKCDRIGESCVPNLMLLPFADLLQWINKRQKHLGWTNKVLAEKSKVPEGTLYRIKAGEEDCKFSTMRNILIALIGGTSDEFSCTEQVERELKHKEQLEQQAARMLSTEAENERLKARLNDIDELHRNDIRVIKEEYREQVVFLREQLKAWQARHHE